MIARKIDCHWRPHVASFAIAVQQDDRGAGAAVADMNYGAIGCDIAYPEFLRKVEPLH